MPVMDETTEPMPADAPEPSVDAAPSGDAPLTANQDYAERLTRLQGKRWKKLLHVQAPWQANLAVMRLGRCLDVGCGNGRNLGHLPKGSVGVDHNAFSIQAARAAGHEAYTVDEFFADPALAAPGSFDSILAAHLIEHLEPAEARAIIGSYLPMVRPGGRVVFITPQERGYASDATHVAFSDFTALHGLADDLGLQVLSSHSFPFPRRAGKLFIYNEFHVIARVRA
jgi:SAM-dependent methyltransferase